MEMVAMILRRPPYGDINAAEAVRHALGAVSGELDASLLLVDGGVLVAVKGQKEAGTGFTVLEGALRDSIDMGVSVYAEKASLRAEGLEASELLDGVRVINGSEMADILKNAKTTFIF